MIYTGVLATIPLPRMDREALEMTDPLFSAHDCCMILAEAPELLPAGRREEVSRGGSSRFVRRDPER